MKDTMKEYDTDILIVGAGPTGLLLACELARQGVSFRIIDRASKPSTLSRGTGIHSRSLEILEDHGMLEKAVEQGFWLEGTHVYRNKEHLKSIPLGHHPTKAEPYPSNLILEQSKTEEILTQALGERGITIERRCELKNFAQDKDGVRVTLSRDKVLERWTCRYIVGCDGPKSRVRDLLGIEFPGFTYPRPYLLAEVELEWDLAQEMYRFLDDAVDLLAIPLGGQTYRLTAWESPSKSAKSTADGQPLHRTLEATPSLEQVQEMINLAVPGSPRVTQAHTLLRYRIESRLATSYGQGRAFIAGDACHVHPPTGSQGLNTGIQDAYNLGWKLASVVRGESPPALLSSYEMERRPVGQWVLNNTNHAAANRFELAGRRFFLSGKKFLMAGWNHLSVNYRDSSIVAQMQRVQANRSLQAGDRAPDGLLEREGTSQRLFHIFRGSQHKLLVFTGEGGEALLQAASEIQERFGRFIDLHLIGNIPPDTSNIPVWNDPQGRVSRDYSVHLPTAVLIRPDGYVGARVGKHMVGQFLLYLEACFLLETSKL